MNLAMAYLVNIAAKKLIWLPLLLVWHVMLWWYLAMFTVLAVFA